MSIEKKTFEVNFKKLSHYVDNQMGLLLDKKRGTYASGLVLAFNQLGMGRHLLKAACYSAGIAQQPKWLANLKNILIVAHEQGLDKTDEYFSLANNVDHSSALDALAKQNTVTSPFAMVRLARSQSLK